MLRCGILPSNAAVGQRRCGVLPTLRGCSRLSLPGVKATGDKSSKVNERGKISSRPGPISPKEQKKQQEAAKAAAKAKEASEQTEASAAAAPASTSPAATPAPVSSSSSSSSSAPQATPATPPGSSVQETPQVVVDRMFKRMIVCAATPVVLGLLLLPVFLVLKESNEDFPLWIVYVSQTLTFGGGLFGITYGILSTSWDPTREGTWLGWTEFQANLPILLNRGGDKK